MPCILKGAPKKHKVWCGDTASKHTPKFREITCTGSALMVSDSENYILAILLYQQICISKSKDLQAQGHRTFERGMSALTVYSDYDFEKRFCHDTLLSKAAVDMSNAIIYKTHQAAIWPANVAPLRWFLLTSNECQPIQLPRPAKIDVHIFWRPRF